MNRAEQYIAVRDGMVVWGDGKRKAIDTEQWTDEDPIGDVLAISEELGRPVAEVAVFKCLNEIGGDSLLSKLHRAFSCPEKVIGDAFFDLVALEMLLSRYSPAEWQKIEQRLNDFFKAIPLRRRDDLTREIEEEACLKFGLR